ncbi:MAG: hypothetical protein Q8M79_06670 [Dehalococcoidia bacterium]|nr:hypothetical protein [Dehalococcoidia bacterium]
MTAPSDDPMTLRAVADAIVQRAADQMRDHLKQVASRLDPFPPFPGAVFAYGIEVEPPAGAVEDIGCVVLGDDGVLYELQLGLDQTQLAQGADAMSSRNEELVRLELPPAEFIGWAYRAVVAATEVLEQRRNAG